MSNYGNLIPKPVKERESVLLIIDDSDYIRERLVEMFDESIRHNIIHQAKDSVEASGMFSEFSPDIILLDIHIPGDNGIKLLEKFKSLRPEVKIIMLTNYPYDHYRKKCVELGADYFFEKSVGMDQLVNVCDNFVLLPN